MHTLSGTRVLRLLAVVVLGLCPAVVGAQEAAETREPKPQNPQNAESPQDPPAENLPQPVNPTFEGDTPGGPPAGWRLGSQGQAEVAVVAGEAAFAGEQAARVTVLRPATGRGLSANLMQGLDAEGWGGRRVRLRAAIRADGLTADSRVQMWFRVDRPQADGKRQFGAFDNMGDRPITAEEWRHHDIVLEVDDDASRIVIGVFLIGSGGFWLDDVSLSEVDESVESTAGGPPTPAKESSTATAPTRDSLVRQAIRDAENAPQQPFWTWWLLLPATLIGLSILAFWPRWSALGSGPRSCGGCRVARIR